MNFTNSQKFSCGNIPIYNSKGLLWHLHTKRPSKLSDCCINHITRYFTGTNPQQVCLVSKLRHSQQNKWYVKRHETTRETGVLFSKNRCPQEISDPNCLCTDLQWKTKEEKEKNMIMFCWWCSVAGVTTPPPWHFPHPVSCALIGFRSSLLSKMVKTNITPQDLDSQTGPDI